MSRKPPRQDMEPVSIDLRLEGHASHASVVEGMNGVSTGTEGSILVMRITASTLREAQRILDAALATITEAQTQG